MNIGAKIKTLRLMKNLTQEELGERTDLSKGFISQLERNMNSPSIDTLFNLLEVLGTTPKEFFDESKREKQIVFTSSDQTTFTNESLKYDIEWLVPRSNEYEMDPVRITLKKNGQFKTFEPSEAETFIYIIEGAIRLTIGEQTFDVHAGEVAYFHATDHHYIENIAKKKSTFLLVATQSYL
ncbi:helix-turn-helix domain-containing protein [Planococcaceae bacterium Storch 2/2-2]|nr:helix-turn-helix domain-containing protein [Planococcaceae bacterium Storch 2/2-2]